MIGDLRKRFDQTKYQVAVAKDGSVLAHSGPMFLNILVVRDGKVDAELGVAAAEKGFSLLDILGKNRGLINHRIAENESKDDLPNVIRRMYDAVLTVGDMSLTPLAAVAGAVSDEIIDYLFSNYEGISKAVVNNGGDIAIRIDNDETVNIGGILDYFKPAISHILTVRGKGKFGVATSGFGGRSFTKGIASAVVVYTCTGSLADAIATYMGNATNVESVRVKRQLAKMIYPETDIPDEWVTTLIGEISLTEINTALEGGMASAEMLQRRGFSLEALFAVKGHIRMTKGMQSLIREVA